MTHPDPTWRLLLVPTDFSPCSDDALRLAARLARQNGAKLILLHVSELTGGIGLNTKVQPDDASKPVTVEEFLKETALRKIGEQARRVAGDLTYTARVAFGPTAVTVVDQARLEGVDLLVVGTHGRTGLRHLLLGSVAERIVRTATVPVLVVRHEEEAREDIHTQAENTLQDEQQG